MKDLKDCSLLLIITLSFTCGENKICLTIKKSQNIMNMIVGFVINVKESAIIPTQKINFLGLIINSVQLILSLTRQKLDKTHHWCWEMYKAPMVSFLELTKLIDLLTSPAQVFLPAKI